MLLALRDYTFLNCYDANSKVGFTFLTIFRKFQSGSTATFIIVNAVLDEFLF